MGAVIFAFLVGLSVGVLLGRRSVKPVDESVPVAPPPRPTLPAVPRQLPTAKARKRGLGPEDFTPSDDILDKLRLAAEGALDPAVLGDEPAVPEAPAPPEPPLPTEAELRVLERLRRQAEAAEAGDAGEDQPGSDLP